MGRTKVISFVGTCAARGVLTLASARIGTPCVLRAIHVSFPGGCQNLMSIRVYAAPDDECPATGKPNGVSVLGDYGQVDYVVGDGEEMTLYHNLDLPDRPNWLKVHADNADYYAHAVNVQLTIEVPSGEEE